MNDDHVGPIYLACHGPDGTLLTRPKGFGPTFASHALSELRSLSNTVEPSMNLEPTSWRTILTADVDDDDDDEDGWNGCPVRVHISSPDQALDLSRRLVASELCEVLYFSTDSLEDLVHQVEEGRPIVSNASGTFSTLDPLVDGFQTWNLGYHAGWANNDHTTSYKHPTQREMKTILGRLREALPNIILRSANQSRRDLLHVKTAAEAQLRLALLIFPKNDDADATGTYHDVMFAIVVVVGQGAVGKACQECHEQRQRQHHLLLLFGSSPFLTPTRPPLSLLMTNLAGVAPGNVVLDPFCGSGAMLWGSSYVGAGLCIGSDVIEPGGGGGGSTPLYHHYKGAEWLQCDAFRLSKVLQKHASKNSSIDGGDYLLDAIVTDPPYGLREDQSRPDDRCPNDKRTLENHNASTNAGHAKSICYIEDYTGEELLQSVSLMMRPVLELAVQHLRPDGGRLVYLLPLIPSQEEMGLWGTTGAFGPDALDRLPSLPGLVVLSAERHRCKKRGMARAIIVMERRSNVF